MLVVSDGSMNYQGVTKVKLNGFYGEFALITIDPSNNNVKINTKRNQPHPNFSDKIYASVSVLNDRGEQIYLHSYVGIDSYRNEEVEFSIKEGYKLIFHHLEPSREMIIDENGKEEALRCEKKEFIIKESEPVDELIYLGEENRMFAKASIDLIKEKVAIHILSGKPMPSKDHLFANISVIDSKEHKLYGKEFIGNQDYIEETKVLDFKDGYQVVAYHEEASNRLYMHDRHGHTFGMLGEFNNFRKSGLNLIHDISTINFYGINDFNFARIFIEKTGKLLIQIEEGEAFSILGDREFAKIEIANEKNESIYCVKFKGNTNNKVREDRVALLEGHTLTVEHLESNRIKVDISGIQSDYRKFKLENHVIVGIS